jgi:hypothetical protein
MKRLVLVSLLTCLSLVTGGLLVTAAPAYATTFESSFSELSTPAFTNSGDQVVVLSGRVQPATAGRAVSLYQETGATDTWLAGAHTDANGYYSFAVRVDVATTFHFFSARQEVGDDVYKGTSSKNFRVKSLRLWDTFTYDNWAGMDAKWDLRQEGLFLDGRKQQRTDRRALGFGSSTLRMKILRDPKKGNEGKFLVPHVTAGDLAGMQRGHLEARIKFGRPKGAHGGLWWQAGYCPGQAEIDAVEFFGERKAGTDAIEPQRVQHTIWNGSDGCAQSRDHMTDKNTWSQSTGAFGPRATWWSDFHDYEVFWNTDGYTFSIDGRQVATIKKYPGATSPAQVILSLLVADFEVKTLRRYLRNGGRLADYTMRVDWIRVWR